MLAHSVAVGVLGFIIVFVQLVTCWFSNQLHERMVARASGGRVLSLVYFLVNDWTTKNVRAAILEKPNSNTPNNQSRTKNVTGGQATSILC